jgi:glycosyltransferase involved in cell wall biosynthesis
MTNSTNKNLDISVVIPLYNEEETVELLHQALDDVLSIMPNSYEIIFVDDGSSDETYPKMKVLAKKDPNLKLIKFRNNCGQSAATDAGFELARGKKIVVMDGDLQNDPKDIPKVLAKMDEGYDLVSGWRKDRKDKLIIRKVPSIIANKLICNVTNVELHDTGCALKVYRSEIVKKINLYGELHRFLPALARIEGARITEIPVNHHSRKFGKSKYGISRTFRVLLDLMSLNLFIKHLQNPIQLFGKISLFFLLCSLTAFIGLAQGFFRNVYGVEEFNVLATISFLFFTSSLLFMFLGLLTSLIFNTGKKKTIYLSELIKR